MFAMEDPVLECWIMILLNSIFVNIKKSSDITYLHDAKTRKNPRTRGRKDIRICKVEPLQDLRLSYRVLSSTKLIIGHVIGNGIWFKQTETIITFECRDLENSNYWLCIKLPSTILFYAIFTITTLACWIVAQVHINA